MICAKHLVYSFEIGILHEARERKSTGPDRVWDLFHALAIRVHARVEITYLEMLVLAGETLHSVYVRELK